MTAVPVVRLEDVTVRMDRREIISHVNLDLMPARITTIIGPNGAGKSTLARVVLGLLKASSGHIVRKPGLQVGYVPQRFHIDPTFPLTVQRFLDGLPPPPELPALHHLRLEALLDKPLSALSGGQLQRVLLARALYRRPELLVLDEPAQGVDLSGQTELYHLIGQAVDHLGCAVLMISHDLHWVMSSTSEVICLNGHICCAGAPQTVAGNRDFQALFGSDARYYGWFRHDLRHHTECDHSHDTDEIREA